MIMIRHLTKEQLKKVAAIYLEIMADDTDIKFTVEDGLIYTARCHYAWHLAITNVLATPTHCEPPIAIDFNELYVRVRFDFIEKLGKAYADVVEIKANDYPHEWKQAEIEFSSLLNSFFEKVFLTWPPTKKEKSL